MSQSVAVLVRSLNKFAKGSFQLDFHLRCSKSSFKSTVEALNGHEISEKTYDPSSTDNVYEEISVQGVRNT